MNEHDEDFADLEIDNLDEIAEHDSSALTWDEETLREAHREVSLRALRASSERLSAVAGWTNGVGLYFRWTVRAA